MIFGLKTGHRKGILWKDICSRCLWVPVFEIMFCSSSTTTHVTSRMTKGSSGHCSSIWVRFSDRFRAPLLQSGLWQWSSHYFINAGNRRRLPKIQPRPRNANRIHNWKEEHSSRRGLASTPAHTWRTWSTELIVLYRGWVKLWACVRYWFIHDSSHFRNIIYKLQQDNEKSTEFYLDSKVTLLLVYRLEYSYVMEPMVEPMVVPISIR